MKENEHTRRSRRREVRPDMGEGEYLTPQQAGELLQVTVRSIYEWMKNGDLPAVKIGGRWRIRRRDIDALWQQKQGNK